MMSNRRISCCPILETLARCVFPPVECWRGTKPTHAAKSRSLRKVSGGGVKTSMATAVMGPMPGIVWRRRVMTLHLARDLNWRSSSAMASDSALILVRSPLPNVGWQEKGADLLCSNRLPKARLWQHLLAPPDRIRRDDLTGHSAIVSSGRPSALGCGRASPVPDLLPS